MKINKFIIGFICGVGLLYLYFTSMGSLPFMKGSGGYTFVAPGSGDTQAVVFDAQQQYEKYKSTYELLQATYYDTQALDVESMQENALKGFVDAIGDPYTVYLTPDENKTFDEGMQGSQNFEGIGAVVTKKDDGIMVETVLKGSPAFNAGVLPLDLIVEIDETPTDTLSLHEGVALIRGIKGTNVVLTILRSTDTGTSLEEITVTRDTISVPSVEGTLIEQDGKKLVHITISVFGDDTITMLERVLKEYDLATIDGIILDLRGNGGGYLPTAVDLVSYFLPKNEIITTAKYSIFDDEVFRSKGYGTLQGIKTVVLVDGLSASASEITAAALQERGGATIIGETTFGKGSIQTIDQHNDGSSLKFTIGRRYTPSGANIDKVGVDPTKTVEFDAEAFLADESDNQLDAAVEYLLTPQAQ